MTTLENHIDRILSGGECLTAVEITLRLNAEFSTSSNPYTIYEIVKCADKMPDVYRSGKEYASLRIDFRSKSGV